MLKAREGLQYRSVVEIVEVAHTGHCGDVLYNLVTYIHEMTVGDRHSKVKQYNIISSSISISTLRAP